jgi:hypothetical protein
MRYYPVAFGNCEKRDIQYNACRNNLTAAPVAGDGVELAKWGIVESTIRRAPLERKHWTGILGGVKETSKEHVLKRVRAGFG